MESGDGMKLFCLGDSLTFGFGVPRAARWTTLLEREIGWDVVNLGINGDTTAGMLSRLAPQVLSEIEGRAGRISSRVILMGGSNDVFFSGTDAQARANMAAMCHRLMGDGVRPMLGISLPVDWRNAPRQWAEAVDFEHAARVMEEYCAWLKRFGRAFNLPVVDFAADFTDGGEPKHELFLDGLHPNGEGHRLMAARMERALRPVPHGEDTREETV